MDEARRFLRYVLPSLAVVVELVLLEKVCGAGILLGFAESASASGLVAALGAILAVGGLGYVLAQVYFGVMWKCPRLIAPIDHRRAVRALRSPEPPSPVAPDRGSTHAPSVGVATISFPTASAATPQTLPSGDHYHRTREAWIELSVWWYSRRASCLVIQSADERVKAMVDTVHMVGTTLIGTMLGGIAWALLRWQRPFGWSWLSGALMWAGIFYLQRQNYADVRARFERLIEGVVREHNAAGHDCLGKKPKE